jgi:hypothetical protein
MMIEAFFNKVLNMLYDSIIFIKKIFPIDKEYEHLLIIFIKRKINN